MDLSLYLSLFIIGAITGSFINMAAYRIPRNINLFYPGSYCDICKVPLKWYEKAPVINYIVTLGRCSNCSTRYSVIYPLTEFLTGLLFIFLYINTTDILHFIFLASILTIFLCISIIDIKIFIIPDKLLIAAAIISLTYFIYKSGTGISYFLMSAAVLFIILMAVRTGSRYIFGREAFGMGDVKLGTLIGFLLGWKPALLAIFFGFVIAGLIILILGIARKISRLTYIPFGPFLVAGMITHILFGKAIIVWYFQLFFIK